MKKVILVDDKTVFKIALSETLLNIGGVEIVGNASTGEEFLKLLETTMPDIVFMDIEMPIMDGIEATKRAIKMYPGLVIIGLSLYDNEAYIDKLIEVGARGYLLKESDNYELFKSIINYPEAEIFFSEDISYKPDLNKNKIKNILIVDDFKTNTVVMKSALNMAGYTVDTSDNPYIALDMIKANENVYDLIVVDYRMPAMNGAELIEEIRKFPRYKTTPLLILSSETDTDKKLLAKKAGATGWLKKPFQLAKFQRIVENSL